MNAPFDIDRECERMRAGIRAMPTARAATPSGPSLLRVSGIAGIAIAVFCVLYFGAQFLRVAF